jgi:hypothetical protein
MSAIVVGFHDRIPNPITINATPNASVQRHAMRGIGF